MNVQSYAYNNSQYVVVVGKTQIIYNGWEGFQMDVDYIANNFDCHLRLTNKPYLVFHTEKEAERFMEYLRPLIEPQLVMIKLLGG